MVLEVLWTSPSKYTTFFWRWYNVVWTSTTLVQRRNDVMCLLGYFLFFGDSISPCCFNQRMYYKVPMFWWSFPWFNCIDHGYKRWDYFPENIVSSIIRFCYCAINWPSIIVVFLSASMTIIIYTCVSLVSS